MSGIIQNVRQNCEYNFLVLNESDVSDDSHLIGFI